MSDGRTWGTIIGGVVGYFTGGIGFAAGAAIGGTVGALLEPKKHTETNRIDDITVSVSKYGDGIPETVGNGRPPLTWVWSTYIIQLPEKQSGGKGGGVENTNYRQFMHGMLCLGKTPPAGSTVLLRKLWLDGKLNYDASSGLSPAQALATKENPWQQLVLLPGFDDQLPWPLMEIYEGVGNTPAFRGRITAAIYGLECPNGRIPQIQIEICINAVFGSTSTTLIEFDPSFLKSVAYGNDLSGVRMLYGPNWSGSYVNTLVEVWDIGLDGTKSIASQFNAETNRPPAKGHSDEPCFVNTSYTGGTTLHYYNDEGVQHQFVMGVSSVSEWLRYAKYGDVFVAGSNTSVLGGPYIYDFSSGALLADLAFTDFVAWLALTESFLYVMYDSRVEKYSLTDYSFVETVCTVPHYSANESAMYVASDTEIYILDTIANIVYLVEDGVLTAQFTGVNGFSAAYGANFHVNGNALLESGSSEVSPSLKFVVRGLTTQLADVAEFIESQALRTGLTADQIDVSTVNDTFWGLTLKGPASARANIAPVLTYSALGVVEEDGLLRFFHRADQTSVVTIDYDELGFAEDGSEPGDPFPVVHANAQELPRSITVSYNDPNFDYQTSTVKAMRYAVDTVLDETQTLDMAGDGDRMASIARRMLFERWLAQNTRSLAVSRAFSYLSAGDVFTVEYPRGIFSEWVASKITDTGARMEIECFPSDSDLIIQTVPGPGGYRAQEIQPLAPTQRLELVDGAIWQDADDNAGVYAVMEPSTGTQGGAELFAGPDDDSLQPRGAVSNAAIVGFAENALGSHTSGLMDWTNSLIVNIGEGELSTTTRALLDATTVNAFALGINGRWEYGQFLRRDSLGDGRYLLSGLVRGIRGSQHNRSTHAAGDVFIMIGEAGTLRPSMDVGSLGSTMSYRAVTTGRSSNSASSKTYANTGEGLKPFSPWDARWTKSAANDITMTWQRRTRLSSNAFRGAVPLGEASESYVIELYTSSALTTLAGTFTSTSKTLTLTSAQQTAIGLTPGAIPYRRIYQVSENVGNGTPLEAIV
jgi:hypothetical protein